jgi:hypothetical protein
MLRYLTRSIRVRAAWLLAALYVMCLVLPAVSFAFGAGRNAACLVEEGHSFGKTHIHSVQADGVDAAPQYLPQANLELKSVSFNTSVESCGVAHGSDDAHKHRSSQCCGLSCVSALPATFAEVGHPAMPPMKRTAAVVQVLADNASKPLYRPTIA